MDYAGTLVFRSKVWFAYAMNTYMEGLVALFTAPFVLFGLILIVSACVCVALAERK